MTIGLSYKYRLHPIAPRQGNNTMHVRTPIVISVHSDYKCAYDALQRLWPTFRITGNIKESSTGYGFVLFTYEQEFKKLVKYDLSYML